MSVKKREAILQEVLKCEDIKSLEKEAFLEAWKAIAFLFGGLHPDGYEDSDSGWPEELKPFAGEAFRRYNCGQFTSNQLYPWQESMKGIKSKQV